LFGDGACHPDQIRKRLLWLAARRGIPVAELPRGRLDVPTPDLVDFCSKHSLSIDWLAFGQPRDLLEMMRNPPQWPGETAQPPLSPADRLLAKLSRLQPNEIAFIDATVTKLLSM